MTGSVILARPMNGCSEYIVSALCCALFGRITSTNISWRFKPHNILVGERDLVKLTDFGAQLYQKKFTFVPVKMAGLC